MKKKIFITLLSLIAALCCVFSIAACDGNSENGAGTEQGSTDDKKGDSTQDGKTDENVTDTVKEPEKVAGTAGLEYTLSDDSTYYFLSGLGTCTETEIVCANYYDGKPVKQIGYYYTSEEIETLMGDMSPSEQQAFIDNLLIFKEYNMTSFVIPDGVSTIGCYIFYGCITLSEISIPDNLTSVGVSAFGCCYELTELKLPETVTEISDGAFYFCSELEQITIGKDVTYIGKEAFYRCEKLSNIIFEGTKEQWEAIEKGENWNYYMEDYTIHCIDGDLTK